MNEFILSIVVPVYNVEKYIDFCLKSIINNYTLGIEIILVDDGSNDKSSSICDIYSKDYNYISVIHKKNGGLSSARNAGIKVAKGKYIWFVDSDDYIKDDSISKIMKYLESDNDLIITSYCDVYNNGKIEEDNLGELINGVKPYEFFMKKGNISYGACRFICKRDIILKNNMFFTEGIYHEDEDWSPRVLYKARTFSVIPGTIYCYRVANPNSIMNTPNPKKIYDKMYIVKSMYNKINTENLEEDVKEFFKFRIEHNLISAINEMILYKGEEKIKVLNSIKEYIYILKIINNKKSKLVYNSIKIFGFYLTSNFLNFRNRMIKFLK